MNTEISTPIKIFAAIGGLLIIGLFGMKMLNSGGSSSPSPALTTPVVTHPAAPATAPVATTPAPASKPATTPPAAHTTATTPATHTATPAAHTATPAAHATTPAHAKPAVAKTKTKTKTKHKPAPAVAADGLPTPLDVLLHIHRVVVVAVWDPEIPTDKLSVAEAKAGAADAHAGFLAVSVLDEKVAAPLTAVAGGGSLLPSPGVLIYKQPAVLMNVIGGFIDRAAVAEAVANALMSSTPAAGTPTPPASATTPSASSTPATTTP